MWKQRLWELSYVPKFPKLESIKRRDKNEKKNVFLEISLIEDGLLCSFNLVVLDRTK